MFRRTVTVTYSSANAAPQPCPIAWIDNFAMRNFTNDAVFDDTLPVAAGQLEIGNRVPLDHLHTAMEAWFRRKSYLKQNEGLHIVEPSLPPAPAARPT